MDKNSRNQRFWLPPSPSPPSFRPGSRKAGNNGKSCNTAKVFDVLSWSWSSMEPCKPGARCITLDKLYVAEQKLYEEVKNHISQQSNDLTDILSMDVTTESNCEATTQLETENRCPSTVRRLWREANILTLNNLKTSLPNVFQALVGFSRASAQAFEAIHGYSRSEIPRTASEIFKLNLTELRN
ncbi:Uncharacterized protein TCM_006084 [Theobroma cacao]|uniref:DUF632 domain-containing protein n=1 Tax=Theobroma cacao TaxID=3641 RepID=A0A061E3U6_THECC|nr:Uncharacterized protein TCM_006084 [Theobroma cacao]